MSGPAQPVSPDGAFRTTAIIGFALANGVFLFSLVALWLHGGEGTWERTSFDAVFAVAAVAAVTLGYGTQPPR